MGFFNRLKGKSQSSGNKAKASNTSAKVEPAPAALESTKNEPLLEKVPDDEPASSSTPGWTSVDHARPDVVEESRTPDPTIPPGFKVHYENEGQKSSGNSFLYYAGCCGASTTVVVGLYAVAFAAATILTLGLAIGPHSVRMGTVHVAMIGNSYFFVNDLPRLMQMVGNGHIVQDSCLHSSGSLLNILKTGNGMYYKWQTQNALMIDGVESDDDGDVEYLYDYGSCSVPKLLTGNDTYLSYQNQYGFYLDDGNNPCFNDQNYLEYEQALTYTHEWDFVVMVDQSKRMSFDEAREDALMAINYTYGPLLDHSGAIPVFVQPHAFWSESVNMTGLGDVPTFTYRIMEGAEVYKEYMDTKRSSLFKKTRIAPVGNAFLRVWEKDYDLWTSLFLDDGVHPSAKGTYLYAMVIYATIYHVMPPKSHVVTDSTRDLFAAARKLHTNTTLMPTKQEANTLWKIAREVTLLGVDPHSFRSVDKTSTSSTQEEDVVEDDDEDEDDDYIEDAQYLDDDNAGGN